MFPRQEILGYTVVEGETTLHYYTNRNRKACICVGCREGRVSSIRLKTGLWGPLAKVKPVPTHALSDCSLETLGTWHNVHLAGANQWNDRDRILKVYGPPTNQTDSSLSYRWPQSRPPAALDFTLENGKIVEIFLQQIESSPGIRPLGAPEDAVYRPCLGSPDFLEKRLLAGENHLDEGRPSMAEVCFDEVYEILEQDDPVDPSFLKVYVSSRWALARAMGGRKEARKEAMGCHRYFQSWV